MVHSSARVAEAALFGWNPSRFFVRLRLLLYSTVNILFLLDPKYDYDYKYDFDYKYDYDDYDYDDYDYDYG